MEIHTPTRKPKYFFCKITDHKKPVHLKIPDAQVQQKVPLSSLQGYMCRVDISKDGSALECIKQIERLCLNSIKENNKKWFKNELDEDTINGMFRSVLDDSVLTAYVSHLRSHIHLKGVTDLEAWSRTVDADTYHVTLICDGLFIYPTHFGLRWIIRGIKDFQDEEIQPEWSEIVHYWEESLREAKETLFSRLARMDVLMDKIKSNEFSESDIQELKIFCNAIVNSYG
jgi:hypothetical protein